MFVKISLGVLALTFLNCHSAPTDEKLQKDVINTNFLERLSLPDPLELDDFTLEESSAVFEGNFSFRNGNIQGLSTLKDTFNYFIENREANYKIEMPFLKVLGTYDINAILRLPDTERDPIIISGAGKYEFTIHNSFIDLSALISNNDVDPQVQDLSFNIDFKSITGEAENLIVNEVPIEWDVVMAKYARPIFRAGVEAKKEVLQDTLQKLFNVALQDCPVHQIFMSKQFELFESCVNVQKLGENSFWDLFNKIEESRDDDDDDLEIDDD